MRTSLPRTSPHLLVASLALLACSQGASVPPGTHAIAVVSAPASQTFADHAPPGREVAFSPDGGLVASSGADGIVTLRRVPDGVLVRTLEHEGGATALAFSPDGGSLATVGYDGALRIWTLGSLAGPRTFPGHRGTAWTVAWSPDGRSIATGGEDSTVRIWRAEDGAVLHTMRGHARNVWSVDFSPDGRLLASGSFDKLVKIWDVETGTLVRTLAGSGEAVVHLAFSPDGATLVTGGDDNMARLWRVADGAPIRTFPVGNHVYSVAFTPDGQWLATAGRARSAVGTFAHQLADRWTGEATGIRIWRVADGTLHQTISGHRDDVWSVAFSANGRWMASSSEDGTTKLWQLAPGIATSAAR